MKILKIIAVSLLSICCITANSKNAQLSDYEKEEMQKAIAYYDNNQPDKAIEIYEHLLTNNPKHFLINYEYALAKTAKKEYAEAIKITKKVEGNSDANCLIYQLQGNTYDFMGERKKAIASYDKGIKKFPKAGCLYQEKANIMLMEHDYNGALAMYEKAMEVEPTYTSSYFRASVLLLGSSEPIWGLIYGEALLLLDKGERNKVIQNTIVKSLRNTISMSNDTLHVSLTKQNTIGFKGLNLIVPFEMLYEMSVLNSPNIKDLQKTARKDILSFAELVEIRKAAANEYESWKDKYPNYLLEYHKKVIDAGCFEVYTMELFKDAYADEYKEFIANEENQKMIEVYKSWVKNNPFEPNEDKLIIRIPAQ